MAEYGNKTCARLEVHEDVGNVDVKKLLFVQSGWKPSKAEPTSFSLAISDGLGSWTFEGTEAFVKKRADAWDKSVSWVIEKIKFYLDVAQPGVTYRFTKTRDNQRKLSFDIEDKVSGLRLTANFPLVNASDPGSVTSGLLEFLYNSNCRLTEGYLRKLRDYDKMATQNEALEKQNKVLTTQLGQSERNMYKKFVTVLNSKKAKLRELKKENEGLLEQVKSKSKERETDDTTSVSSEEDDEESEHEPNINEDIVYEDPDATQPLLDEIENDVPIPDPPKEAATVSEPPKEADPIPEPPNEAVTVSKAPEEAGTSSLSDLVGDKPYVGLQRKKRRN